MSYLRTSDLARAVGVHPNTVRRYGDRGILPPVTRTPSGYRQFTRHHLDCLRLAHEVYGSRMPDRVIRQLGIRIVQTAREGDLTEALELAYSHLTLVRAERAHADAAAELLERWASGELPEPNMPPLTIGQVARVLGVTNDMLRNWDRNGLIDVPRNPANGYRLYGAPEINRLRVIRMLSRSGYSIAAILRMLLQLDRGETTDVRHALDTPRPDEDARLASDRWLTTLTEQEQRAHTIIALIDGFLLHQP